MIHPYPSASLYVGNLASDVFESQLFEIFSVLGPISLIRVCRDAVTRRRSLGYAYVNYHSILDAERALDLLNNTLIKGRPCRIMWSQRDPSLRKSGVGNVFVKNLDRSIGNKELNELFSPHGNILSCKVAFDENTGYSKGYGFVHFEDSEAANKAIALTNNKIVKDKAIFVGPFLPKKERTPIEDNFTNVYVKNLDDNFDEAKLRELFEPFGNITSLFLMYDKEPASQKAVEADNNNNNKSVEATTTDEPKETSEESQDQSNKQQQSDSEKKKSKGFGFVNFAEHSQAVAAVEALNGKAVTDSGKLIFVGKAQKKSDRAAELRKKFQSFPKNFKNSHNPAAAAAAASAAAAAPSSSQTASAGPVNLFIRNFDPEYDEASLMKDFSDFGPVHKVKIMRDEKGVSRSYGFVSFMKREDAQKAVFEFKKVNKAGQSIHVAFAHKKQQQPSEQQDKFRNNNWQGAQANNGAGFPTRSGKQNFGQTRRYNSNNANNTNSSSNSTNNGGRRNQQSKGKNQQAKAGANIKADSKQNKSAPKQQEQPKTEQPAKPQEEKTAQEQQQKPQQSQEKEADTTATAVAASVSTATPSSESTAAAVPSSGQEQSSELSLESVAEQLYPIIHSIEPELSGKITGMLMESFPKPEELAVFLSDQQRLRAHITEAVDILQKSM